MELKIDSLEQLKEAATLFAEHITAGQTYAFYGKMGAGKTTFIKAVAECLGVEDVVTSPTFAIINEYDGSRFPIYHFDFYRIKNIEEAYDIGLDDYLYGMGVCFIEWPELIEPLLPDDAIRISITADQEGKRVVKEMI